jgi:hypothetical protein
MGWNLVKTLSGMTMNEKRVIGTHQMRKKEEYTVATIMNPFPAILPIIIEVWGLPRKRILLEKADI